MEKVELNAYIVKYMKIFSKTKEEMEMDIRRCREELKKLIQEDPTPEQVLRKLKQEYSRASLRPQGRPHVGFVYYLGQPYIGQKGDTGDEKATTYAKARVKAWRENPAEAISKGLVAGPEYHLVKDGVIPEGTPLGEDGEPLQGEKRRFVRIVAAPFKDGKVEDKFKVYGATLFRGVAEKFNPLQFEWIQFEGLPSKDGKYFNINTEDWSKAELDGYRPPYESVVLKMGNYCPIPELEGYYAQQEKDEYGKTREPVVIKGTVTLVDPDFRKFSGRMCWRMVVEDELDPENRVRVYVPIYLYKKPEFAEDSDVMVCGEFAYIEEQYQAGCQWSMVAGAVNAYGRVVPMKAPGIGLSVSKEVEGKAIPLGEETELLEKGVVEAGFGDELEEGGKGGGGFEISEEEIKTQSAGKKEESKGAEGEPSKVKEKPTKKEIEFDF